MVRFATRVPGDLSANRITRALRATTPRYDLTVSNPTEVGLDHAPAVLTSLGDPAGLRYRPDPRGLRVTREAVAGEFARLGARVDADRIVLTASTSEAYAFLFKVLAEPGDEILVPTPSYPLFEHLARLEGVRAVPYRLEADAAWRIDLATVAASGAQVRAIVVVHPNNPTGSFIHPDDRAALAGLCRERGWALIADEVFLDYPLDGGGGCIASFASETRCLTFTLGGLSKSAALPQLKLAWIATSGPAELAAAALDRLEFIADTFLSVGTPVALAAPDLIAAGTAVRDRVLSRCRANLAALRTAVAGFAAVEVLPVGGGWSVVMRVPAIVADEELIVELLERDGVAVFPGYFFDIPRDGYLVLSLLPRPGVFAEGIGRLLARVTEIVARPGRRGAATVTP